MGEKFSDHQDLRNINQTPSLTGVISKFFLYVYNYYFLRLLQSVLLQNSFILSTRQGRYILIKNAFGDHFLILGDQQWKRLMTRADDAPLCRKEKKMGVVKDTELNAYTYTTPQI